MKPVSGHRGKKLITVPGSGSRIIVSQSVTGSDVNNFVNYYTKISTPRELTKTSSQHEKITHKISHDEVKNESSEEEIVNHGAPSRMRPTKVITDQMEEAVKFRMETISKTRGTMFAEMMKNETLNGIFDDNQEKEKDNRITRLLDVSCTFILITYYIF